jgi:actin-related protein
MLCCAAAGGTSLLSQMRERLELDISAAAPGGTKVKVTAPVNPTERRYATWIGGLHTLWCRE